MTRTVTPFKKKFSQFTVAQAIEVLARSPEKRGKLGKAIERRVRTEFDHNASIRQLMALFEDEWREELHTAAE